MDEQYTSRGHTGGRPHRILHFPSAVLALIYYFLSREGFSHPFPSSTVKSNFSDPRINDTPLLVGHIYIFFVRKNPSSCDCTEIRTHIPTSKGFEVTTTEEPPGRPRGIQDNYDTLFCFYCFSDMAINVSVQYNGGLLDIILLTQCYFHRRTRLNAVTRFCIYCSF